MWLTQWFKTNIQSKLPSESKIRAIIIILMIVIVCLVLIIIYLHKYTHTFWQDKPVAWTTIFPTRTGILKNSSLPSFQSTPKNLSNDLHLKYIQWSNIDSSKEKYSIQNQLSSLWNVSTENVQDMLDIPDTRRGVVFNI